MEEITSGGVAVWPLVEISPSLFRHSPRLNARRLESGYKADQVTDSDLYGGMLFQKLQLENYR